MNLTNGSSDYKTGSDSEIYRLFLFLQGIFPCQFIHRISPFLQGIISDSEIFIPGINSNPVIHKFLFSRLRLNPDPSLINSAPILDFLDPSLTEIKFYSWLRPKLLLCQTCSPTATFILPHSFYCFPLRLLMLL